MTKSRSTKTLSRKDIDRLADRTRGDAPEGESLGREFWKSAKVAMPVRKNLLSLRLDEDVIEFFRAQGKGYQSRMNAVLRAFVDAHKDNR